MTLISHGRELLDNEAYQCPVSFAQQRLWLLGQMAPGSAAYNINRSILLRGHLNVAALAASLDGIVQRHETLRTTFRAEQGQPLQVIAPHLSIPLPLIDLTPLPPDARTAEVQKAARAEARQPFDLTRGPLLRTTLLRLAPEEHLLLVTIHHIVADEWSISVVLRELAALYTAHVHGQESPLSELPIQYADYAAWQHEWLQSAVLEESVAYWREQLAGAPPVLELPTDRPRPPWQRFVGASLPFKLDASLSAALVQLSRQEETTLFMTLLAVFQVLLHRYSGQDDVVVGSPIAGRTRTELEGLIGFFVNTLALRTHLSGNPTFQEVLARVRTVAWGAYAHQELPFERVVEELHPQRELSYNPLFQVMFVLQNVPSTDEEFAGLEYECSSGESGAAKVDMTLFIGQADEGLVGLWEYNTDLFESATIERMVGHFETLLRAIVADPAQHIGQLPLLSAGERELLLVTWNATQMPYPREHCVHDLFAVQARRTPDAIAVVCRDQQLTYSELNRRANRLAHHLQGLGVGPEVRVGLYVERSVEMLVGMLGVLKAGGAYVPLDPTYPQTRLSFILEDAGVAVVVTQQRLSKGLPQDVVTAVCLDGAEIDGSQLPEEDPATPVTADNLAYVMYTSGSTGKPKGVEIVHRGIVRLLFGVDYARLDATQTILQMSTPTFDAATFEIWGALLHGARCVLFPARVPALKDIGAVIHRHNITTVWLTASLFNAVIDQAPDALTGVRQLLTGGEALSVTHVRRARALFPSADIINGYGPTESTTFACCYRVPAHIDEGVHSIPIGRPIGNTEVYLLDRYLQLVPIGVPGELHIGGAGLARGYLNRAELTAEKFIAHPWSSLPGARLYKTGDLARYWADGQLEFLGRLDHQVKIRGFRIELGEVEAVLGQHPAVREVVVVAREDTPGDQRLVAYVVAESLPVPTSSDLRCYLADRLPEYMVPATTVWLQSLPLTSNGKIDARALPAPAADRSGLTHTFVPPRLTLHHQLVAIWEDLLHVHPIGIADNFFDLGGHSLLAARMLHEVERVCGRKLPLAHLFATATINSLTTLLQAESAEPRSLVVQVQPGRTRRPFFFLHGDPEGGGFYCAKVAQELGEDQPFYALQPHGIDGGTVPPTIEAMATSYIGALRIVQPDGPYRLGGFCAGGLVAFEMARQLEAQGEKVDVLALVHPVLASRRNRLLSVVLRRCGRLAGLSFASQIECFLTLQYYAQAIDRPSCWPLWASRALAEIGTTVVRWATQRPVRGGAVRDVVRPGRRGEQHGRARRIARQSISWLACFVQEHAPIGGGWRGGGQDRPPASLLHHYRGAIDPYIWATAGFVPRPYHGRVVVFWPREERWGRLAHPARAWSRVAENVEFQTVPGGHVTCITRYSASWAHVLKTILTELAPDELNLDYGAAGATPSDV